MTDALTLCWDLRAQLEDILRLLTTMAQTLSSPDQAGNLSKTGSLERCQHNILLIKQALDELAQKIDTLEKKSTIYPQSSDIGSIKKIIRDLQEHGKWLPGVFLQTLKERLQTVENDLEGKASEPLKITSSPSLPAPAVKTALTPHEAPELTTVYIHLYQATGKTLSTWLPQLHNLRSLVQSRPVYATEADVLSVLEARGHSASDAYLTLLIPKAILLPPFRGRQHIDKYGHELLVIDSDRFPAHPHIGYFFHQGKRYHLEEGEWVLI